MSERPVGERRFSKSTLPRDLALFQLYRFLSTSYLFAPIIMVFFGARGLSVTEITLLNTVYCVAAVLFEVPTGVLADRWGRKRAMVLGSLMMAAGCLINFLGHSFVLFAIGEGLLALGMTLSSGSDSAYLYDRLRDAGRAHEYRRYEGAASASKLCGAAVALAAGGWLARHDVAMTYLVTALVCLAASGVAGLLGEARYERPQKGSHWVSSQIIASARLVLSHPPLRFAVIFSTLIFTLVRMGIYLHQPLLTATGFSISDVGMIMAGFSLLAAFGAQRIDSIRRLIGERTLVWTLPAVLAGSYLVLGRFLGGIGIAMLALQWIASGVYSPLSKDLLNREIADSSHRATLLSVESMARRLAFGMFAPLVGWTIDTHDLHAGLYVCAALAAVGTVALASRMVRRHREFGASFEGERTPTPIPERSPPSVVEARAVGGE
ncbi:MAG: MFS transporter [Myxococcales bacterium]|nr:MFS transporter [Myxococcales bacterium]